MIVTHEREKLIHAIVFFCNQTKQCRTVKLFKLLHHLDMEHFRQTGRTVTGLRYYAWKQGPVPASLWNELDKSPKDDLARAMTITAYRDAKTNDVERRDLKPKIAFNKKLFSQRELSIMNRIALLFNDAESENLSELSHMNGQPWQRVWAGGSGKGKEIPSELALKTERLQNDVPTISPEELAYRRELLKGIS